jgi:PAS domain S-box-containing protein
VAHDARFLSEEVLAHIFHASPVALSLSTLAEGRYLEVNGSFLRVTGYARDEVIGRRSVELGLWAVVGDRDRIVEALRERRTLNDCEILISTKAGEPRLLLAFFELIEVGGQTCIFSLFHDITQRQQTHSLLKKLSSVVEQTADNVFITNYEGVIEYVNAAFEQLTGYSRNEAIGPIADPSTKQN